MKILGIETSCDETSAAVVQGGMRVLSNVVASQIALHQAHGGVVPELAARGHVTAIIPVVETALAEAEVELAAVDAIAVTVGPGLAGSLLVGVNVAKSLAYALDKPLIPVNHLEGHVYANWLTPAGAEPRPAPRFPVVCLLVSGGHTELILMTGHREYRHLGRTLDDAAGEAFDKGARLLGLGYPGGPAIQKAAAGGRPDAFELPRAWLGESDDFSFSGLKTAVIGRLRAAERAGVSLPVPSVCCGVLEAVVEVLVEKAIRAALDFNLPLLTLSGGVAANATLCAALAREAERQAVAFLPCPRALATDNAAMIAGVGYHLLAARGASRLDQDVAARLPLGSRVSA